MEGALLGFVKDGQEETHGVSMFLILGQCEMVALKVPGPCQARKTTSNQRLGLSDHGAVTRRSHDLTYLPSAFFQRLRQEVGQHGFAVLDSTIF